MPKDLYFRPKHLQDALRIRSEHSGAICIAAGCTDLLPATERKRLTGSVLDVTGMAELRGITYQADGLRIGAATSWREIFDADLPPACRALQMAAGQVGARQIQNQGTIGGNLCNASPAADGVPALLCLQAQVELQSRQGRRVIALEDFLQGVRKTDLQDDEIMTAVVIPSSALTGISTFSKLGARSYLVISIVMVAARLRIENGVICDAALSIGACSAVATRLPAVETALLGQPPDPACVTKELIEQSISPIADIRADEAYRADAALEITRQVVADLARDAA